MNASGIPGAVSPLHPALAGHFPGNPVVPGVVVLDHVCRALMRDHGVLVKALPLVKFHVPLRPAEAFTIEITETGTGCYSFRVVRGATLIAAGALEAEPGCARPEAD